MNKFEVIAFWKDFFNDLLTGTIRDILLFTFIGFGLGMAASYGLHQIVIPDKSLWKWISVPLAFLWYGVFGCAHGLAFSTIRIVHRKLYELVKGLHSLLDLLSNEVLGKFPRFDRNIPKADLSQQFDLFGKQFLDDLRLKKGLLYLPVRLTYSVVLRSLRFFFLNDVLEELNKIDSHQITSSDIENAVRRVGVQMMLSPIQDNFILIQFLNCVLMFMSFGIPFLLFLVF